MLRIAVLSLLAVAVAGAPACLLGQESTNRPSATKKSAPKSEKKSAPLPFNGKVAEVDNIAKTITVGTMKIEITSETKLNKAGKPAILQDVAKGDEVSGSYRKSADGRLVGVTINASPKAGADDNKKKTTEKKKQT
jgi:hypothetical protein